MDQGYGAWPECEFTSDEIDWKTAAHITAGVDIGTTSSQAAIMCDGVLFGYSNMRTGVDFRETANAVIQKAFGKSGMTLDNVETVIGTGFGRRNISYATKYKDEVHCHAKGARFLFGPDVRTVVNIGGQTATAIRLYDWDRVWDFFHNDRCATGMGRGIEMLCDILHIPLVEIGEKSLDITDEPFQVSTTCHAFAATETLGLFGRPEYKEKPLCENEVYASYMFAVAWRILGMIGKLQPLDVGEIAVYKELGFTGGLAKNPGITKRIERELNVKALNSSYDPQLAGAIGAALLA